jgi:hypothetical protein
MKSKLFYYFLYVKIILEDIDCVHIRYGVKDTNNIGVHTWGIIIRKNC